MLEDLRDTPTHEDFIVYCLSDIVRLGGLSDLEKDVYLGSVQTVKTE